MVERFKRRVSSYLRRRLSIFRSTLVEGNKNKLTLPINSLSKEFMAAIAREVLQYRESKCTKVSQGGTDVRTCRKWDLWRPAVQDWVLFQQPTTAISGPTQSEGRGQSAPLKPVGGVEVTGCMDQMGRSHGHKDYMARVAKG